MDNMHLFVWENHQVNGEKPPPQMCPRCYSHNTRFCYYNNYSLDQPRYTCKNCRRLWTHSGTIRNIPVGGSGRKSKRPRTDQPSVAQVVPVESQQVNHQQSILHDQETNDFLGSIGSSSSVAVVENQFTSLVETYSDMVFPVRSLPQMDRTESSDGSYTQGFYHVGNQEDPNKPRQSFNDTMTMNHNASTSGSRG
ncbi:unnamed protein product [Eruca vesicaria subsp. sativa]|uniref:Dof zinc finger protein n=1 Tax=Eruca vesicaria subsp. sativa TaxID=29727 RepID=A0ABC8M1I7_ERUVS|nr:unnamed protein product [Eruca vesicaria subsp. sativa]